MLLLPIASLAVQLAVLATHGERHEEHPPVGGFRCDLPVESSVGFKPETFEEKYRGKQVSQSAPLPACTVHIRAHTPVFPGRHSSSAASQKRGLPTRSGRMKGSPSGSVRSMSASVRPEADLASPCASCCRTRTISTASCTSHIRTRCAALSCESLRRAAHASFANLGTRSTSRLNFGA